MCGPAYRSRRVPTNSDVSGGREHSSGGEGWLLPDAELLFERVGKPEEGFLAPGRAHESDANRQSMAIACRNGDQWIPGNGGQRGCATQPVVSVDEVDAGGGAVGRGNEG